MKIILDKVYKETIDKINFGNISQKSIFNLLRDGRVASGFIENWMATNFSELEEAQTKDFDFKLKKSIEGFYTAEQKLFTRLGCKFYPSRMIGVGRKLNPIEAKKTIEKSIYLIVYINEMPKIYFKFVKGKNLLKRYPKFVIPFNKKEEFFA
jgi:hypothetical protein